LSPPAEDEEEVAQVEETGSPNVEEATAPRQPRQPRAPRAHGPVGSTGPEAAFFRSNVIERCLQDLRNDGQTLPRTRYTFSPSGRVEPRTSLIQQRFARCVVGTRVPAAEYTFTLP